MGIMGDNIRLISARWRCGHDYLINNNDTQYEPEMLARADSIKELTSCLEDKATLMNYDREDIMTLRNFVASY